MRIRLSPLFSHARVPLHRNAYALVLSAGSTAVLGLVYWLLAARVYTASTLGTQSALLSAVILLAGLGEFGADTLLIRFLPAARGDARRLLIRTYAATTTFAALIAIVFLVGTKIWSPPLSFVLASPWWFVAFVLAAATNSVFALQDSVLTGLRQAVWVPVENGLVSAIKIVLLIALAKVFANVGLFASWNTPAVLAVVLVNLFVFRRLLASPAAPKAVDASALPRPMFLVRYALGNYLGSIFGLVSINVMPLIVIYRLGPATAAHFFIPWTIYNGLQFIATKVSYSLVVEIVTTPEHVRSYLGRALMQSLALLTPICLVLVLWAPDLLGLFGSRYSATGGNLLRWLAVASIPAAVVPFAITLARVRNRSAAVAAIQGGSCVLLLATSYALLGRWGITGVGVAAFTSSTAVAAVLGWSSLRPALRHNRENGAGIQRAAASSPASPPEMAASTAERTSSGDTTRSR